MKTYKYILSAIAALVLLGGCSLAEVNLSGVSTDEEWRTAAGYEKLVNNCYYDLIRTIYGQAEDTFVVNVEGGTDIWQDVSGSGNWKTCQTYDGAFDGLCGEAYTGFYATLNNCNAAISYAEKVEGLSPERIDELVAEARFIRAHTLLNIVEEYGGKYLATTPTSDPVSVLECSKVNEFYKVILEDAQFAIDKLPVKQEVLGHVTRAAAYHLYAKAALTYASYTDGLGNSDPISSAESTELIGKAREAAEYLIEHASELGVRLYSDVNEVFDEDNNKSNDEALFIVCHSMQAALNPRGNYYNRVWKHFGAYNASGGVSMGGMTATFDTEVNGHKVPPLAKCNRYMAPSKYLLDLYVEKDMRYAAFFADTYYVNNSNILEKDDAERAGHYYRWTEADAVNFKLDTALRVNKPAYDIELGDTAVYISRRTYTQAERDATRYAVYNIEDNYTNPAQPGYFYPSLKKFDTPKYYAGGNASKPYSGADCIIYRLGETYLLSAEASWRLGDTGKAASRLNELRNRSCEGHDHSLDITAGDVNEDFILDEYAREMCGEWNRWYTLKRFRAFETRLAKYNTQAKFNKDIHYVRPVPAWILAVIDNPGEYQNPGY